VALPACGAPLELELPGAEASTFATEPADGLWRYRGWLPAAEPVQLGEPRTALVELQGDERRILAKLEGGLPTGSFKDRGAAVTVSLLRSQGVGEIVVDSSGNAGAAFAAYATRAGLRSPRLRPGRCLARQAPPDDGSDRPDRRHLEQPAMAFAVRPVGSDDYRAGA
jgi:threonine synthase